MRYTAPPLVTPADPLAEQPMWRLTTIRPDHPRFKHLPLVKGVAGVVIEVVRGDGSWFERLTDHPDLDKLFERPGKTFFVVENRLGDVALIRTDARTAVALIELHLYCAPLRLQESAGAAESMAELIESLESQAQRLRELADDAGSCFATRPQAFTSWWTLVARMSTSPQTTCHDRQSWLTSRVPRQTFGRGTPHAPAADAKGSTPPRLTASFPPQVAKGPRPSTSASTSSSSFTSPSCSSSAFSFT